jgi:hypothetical protein
MAVSYLDADASSPGFTVTDSISIGQQGWYLETSGGTRDHMIELKSTAPLVLPADKVTPSRYSLGVDENLITSPLKPNAPHIKDEINN